MPASPISKEITLPDNWVQLQKTMIPDSNTCCYWSVWYNPSPYFKREHRKEGTASLMWCPFNENPSVNDNWGHVEEIDEECRNVLTAIESVYKVSFHESIWVELPAKEFPLSE